MTKSVLDDRPSWPNSCLFIGTADAALTTEGSTGLYLHALPIYIEIDGESVKLNHADWLSWLKAEDFAARNKAHIIAFDACPDLPEIDELSFYDDEINIWDQSEFDSLVHNAELTGEVDGCCLWLPNQQTGWIDHLFSIDQIIEAYQSFSD